MGVVVTVAINTDASAAKGIATRKGLGKARRIEVNQLWLQDKVGKGEVQIRKVDGGKNIADALTKHVEAEKVSRHSISVCMRISSDRHELMPHVAIDESE